MIGVPKFVAALALTCIALVSVGAATAFADSAGSELTPKHIAARAALVEQATTLVPGKPFTSTLRVPPSPNSYVAQMHLQVRSGDYFDVSASADGHPFMLVTFKRDRNRLLATSSGVLTTHEDEALGPAGLLYFANYLPENSVKTSSPRIEVQVEPIGRRVQRVAVDLLPPSALQVIDADFRELSVTAPKAVDGLKNRTFAFDVQTRQRGAWEAPAKKLSLNADQQGGVADLVVRPIKTDRSGLGTYRVSGLLQAPGTIRLQLSGAYNSPSVLVSVGVRTESPGGRVALLLLMMPIALAVAFTIRNRMKRNT